MACGCGRERSAMAAWRLRPLVLGIVPVLFSVMPHGASSEGQGPLPGRNITCNRTPHPFGVHGDAVRGFEVTCGPNNESMLPIGKHSYKIDSVSVEGGSVVIFAGPIRQSCYDGNGKLTQATGIDDLSLQGTPFSLSKRNKLVVAGCNYRLVANFSNSPSLVGEATTCSTYCDENSGDVDCDLGVACCEAPMPMNTIRDFTLKFDKIPGMGDEAGTCSSAFFLDQDEEVFVDRPLRKDVLLPAGDHRMILDWAVGQVTCDQAVNYSLMPLCNSLSYCVDAPRGGGYLCRCNPGYEGDPYAEDGCLGFDVCTHHDKNGCQKPFPTDPVLGVSLALVVAISTTSLCYYWALKRRKVRRKRAELFRKNGGLLLQQRFSAITSQSKDSSAKIFSAEELRTATNNYNETRILGRGAYGTVYKGVLPDEAVVAVKKSRVFDESQVEQFVNEITILSQTDHPNVVKLLGCCLETEVPLLVYEFIPNGTLFQHINNRSAPCSLTWEDTLRMAAETAEALAYLHSNSSIPIIHRDIKSSNILLDENFVAKISDFGASRSVPFDQTHVTTLIQGTIGYLDPEYFQSGQLTGKSDVYSFGVVLAELLTRKKPFSAGRPKEPCCLAMHMVTLVNEGCLLNEIEPHILAEAGEEQIYAVAQLSVRCLNMNGQERPMMKEVASVLEELRRSFTKEQTMRRTDEQCNEQGNLVREASSTSSLHRSEVSAKLSMEAEMKASCHTPR